MGKVEIDNFYCFIGETIDGIKVKLHVYVHDISICITCVFIVVAHSLLLLW